MAHATECSDGDNAAQLLHDLGGPLSRLVEGSLAQLSPEARAAVAEQLAGGARLVVVVDLAPFAARVVLHREGQPPLTLAALLAEMPPSRSSGADGQRNHKWEPRTSKKVTIAEPAEARRVADQNHAD